jgi:hypothetical protein
MDCPYCNVVLPLKKNFCPQCGNRFQNSKSRITRKSVLFIFVIIFLIAGVGATAYVYNDLWIAPAPVEQRHEPPETTCEGYLPGADSRKSADRTMHDMNFIHLQLEKYRLKNGKYPFGDWQKVHEVIGVDLIDDWSNAYQYVACRDQNHYALISAGGDRIFDRETWMLQGNFSDPNQDLFLQNGTWLRSYSEKPSLLLVHKYETVFDELD